ncbi:MAG: tetratricopeptide repeat protein [Myxococcota bacterium]
MAPTSTERREKQALLELRRRFREAERDARRGRHDVALQGFRTAAWGYRDRGLHQLELAVWTSAAALSRADGRLHEGAAEACLALGRSRDAAFHLDAARRLYLGGDDPEPLDRVLRRLIRLAPNHVPALSQLGLLAFEQGSTHLGRRCLERAIELCQQSGDEVAAFEIARRLSRLTQDANASTSTLDLAPTTRPTRLRLESATEPARRRRSLFRLRPTASAEELSAALQSSAGIAPVEKLQWQEKKGPSGLSLDDLAQFLVER